MNFIEHIFNRILDFNVFEQIIALGGIVLVATLIVLIICAFVKAIMEILDEYCPVISGIIRTVLGVFVFILFLGFLVWFPSLF